MEELVVDMGDILLDSPRGQKEQEQCLISQSQKYTKVQTRYKKQDKKRRGKIKKKVTLDMEADVVADEEETKDGKLLLESGKSGQKDKPCFSVDSEAKAIYQQILDTIGQGSKNKVKMLEGGDEADGINRKWDDRQISMERMKFAINCLDVTSNYLHSFMGLITNQKTDNRKHLLNELDSIDKDDNNLMSLEEFTNFTVNAQSSKASVSQRLLFKHIKGIAEAKQLNVSMTLSMVISSLTWLTFVLMLIVFFLIDDGEISKTLQFDT